ncbi:phage tail terminator protein [Janthinobacterium aquaticum]|uniref:phage tail terminator protein n=1 Tax=Janthinobacterium sp. FT58W TaxID=2654254 RepID=UPI0012648169|nr:hypothetical protein [Janthinobacterium sp. FT58W]KAB8037409.1 hypothetical protein GCM43_23680 [Janthinobacterium sp. FT58W]
MIDEIMARLRTLDALKLVAGAAGFQTAVESNPTVTPAAFVIPQTENPGPSLAVDVVMQLVQATVGIVFVVRNVADPHGVAAQQDLAPLRQAVKELLMGWVPVQDYAPLERGASNLLVFQDGHMWWQDIYMTSFYDRSTL